MTANLCLIASSMYVFAKSVFSHVSDLSAGGSRVKSRTLTSQVL
jgi:hypothetical protein